jgi:hypothetical protein
VRSNSFHLGAVGLTPTRIATIQQAILRGGDAKLFNATFFQHANWVLSQNVTERCCGTALVGAFPRIKLLHKCRPKLFCLLLRVQLGYAELAADILMTSSAAYLLLGGAGNAASAPYFRRAVAEAQSLASWSDWNTVLGARQSALVILECM